MSVCVCAEADGTVDVHDHTATNVVNLRRTIYLTIVRLRVRFHGKARTDDALADVCSRL